MKLQKFEEKNQQKKGILLFSICCIFLIAGVFLYQSFALFQVEENFNVLNGNIEDPGDLYFAYYVDDKITQDMPTKNSGYTLSEKSFCNNGVIISWDEERWGAFVDYTNYKKENSSRTKCTLYFEEKKEPPKPSDEVKDYIIANVPEDHIILDDETEDHNMRFIGANPNNYIYFNCDDPSNPTSETCELWRIIGVMNNIKSSEEDEVGETRIKIRKATNITNGLYWDESASGINKGYGVNEWSQSKLMKLLNPGYESEATGGSLYWNRKNGRCIAQKLNGQYPTCDFTMTGLLDSAKNFIKDVLWNTGSNGSEMKKEEITTLDFYRLERSNNVGNGCSHVAVGGSTFACDDNIPRTTTWIGKVGLVYPSDYGYSTSSTDDDSRDACLNLPLTSWNSGSGKSCRENTWISFSGTQWTMTPSEVDSRASVFYITSNSIGSTYAVSNKYIFPTVYLKSNVKIISGSGESTNPFIIDLQ